MQIKGPGVSLYNQMQAMAQQARGPQPSLAVQRLEPHAVSSVSHNQSDFGAMLKGALDHVNDLNLHARQVAADVEMGVPGVTIAEAMIVGAKSSIAFEATVQVRNKVVEAYKEIMTMPV